MSESTDQPVTVDSMKSLLKQAQEANEVSDRSRNLLTFYQRTNWTREDVAAHIISFCTSTQTVQLRNRMRTVLFDMMRAKNKKGKDSVLQMKHVCYHLVPAFNKHYSLARKVLRREMTVEDALKAARK